ncbi:MAG: hypothetical protein VCD00_12220 [Candidatus Hydrogenedentota bacterium]
MNPILQAQLNTLTDQLDTLQSVLETNREDVNKQHEEKEAMLKKEWEQRKEVTTLNRIADDYDEVDETNKQYKQEREEIRQKLNEIVLLTKALHGMQKK